VKKSILALTLLIPSAATADSLTLKQDQFACKSLYDWEKVAGMVKTKDTPAFMQFMQAKIPSRECTILKAGMVVSADHKAGDHECLRAQGEIECYWSTPIIQLSKHGLY